MMNYKRAMCVLVGLVMVSVSVAVVGAQSSRPRPTPPGPTKPGSAPPPVAAPASASLPPDYVIGIEDVLGVAVWREKDLATEAIVRPDGKISFPLIGEIQAAGLKPEQLKANIAETLTAKKLVEDPEVAVVVKQINSLKVFVLGQVAKVGPQPLIGPTRLLQIITMAGGLLEYADKKHILIVSGTLKRPDGQQMSWIVSYEEILQRKNLEKNNPYLKSGDTVIVR